jgi:hypothetical protein
MRRNRDPGIACFKEPPAIVDTRVGKLGLDPKLGEFVRLRVSQVNGCVFCID